MTDVTHDRLLEGDVAVVTGAGHGLGKDFARILARLGAAVVVNDVARSEEGGYTAEHTVAEIVDAGGRAIANTGSVADPDGARGIIDSAVAAFGRVDVVVNNAGVVYGAALHETEVHDFRRMLDVHVTGTFMVTKNALVHMRRESYGRIINLTSNAVLGLPRMTAYSAAKGAIIGLTKSLAAELDGEDILVNVVAPMAATNPGRTSGAAASFVALGTRAAPEFVSPLIAYLSSRECAGSGRIYSAVGGRYAEVFFGVTDGWLSEDLKPPLPEDVQAHLAEIRATDVVHLFDTMDEEPAHVGIRLTQRGLGDK